MDYIVYGTNVNAVINPKPHGGINHVVPSEKGMAEPCTAVLSLLALISRA